MQHGVKSNGKKGAQRLSYMDRMQFEEYLKFSGKTGTKKDKKQGRSGPTDFLNRRVLDHTKSDSAKESKFHSYLRIFISFLNLVHNT